MSPHLYFKKELFECKKTNRIRQGWAGCDIFSWVRCSIPWILWKTTLPSYLQYATFRWSQGT